MTDCIAGLAQAPMAPLGGGVTHDYLRRLPASSILSNTAVMAEARNDDGR